MSLFFLRLLAAALTRLPLPVVKAFSAFAGEIVFLLARERRRLLLSNLSHAFPDRDYRWLVKTGRESAHQMVEFGLLAVALPCFDEKRLREIISISRKSKEFLRAKVAAGRPVVLLGPHLGPQEGLCLLPLLVPEMNQVSAIYRPVKNPAVDQWVRQSRERFGVQLFSRKDGLQKAIRLLKENRWVGLLFDQNSSGTGALITFFDRVASVTDLPGILAAKYEAEIIFVYAKRQDFWRIELRAAPGPSLRQRDEITFATNQWLQELLRNDETLVPGWLWAHNRWRHQRIPQFSLRAKKNLLQRQDEFLGRDELPRTERFFIRLPDRPEEVNNLLPLLQAIRDSRPDVAITVIGKENLTAIIREHGLCERVISLPHSGLGSIFLFRRLARHFPQVYLLFTDSWWHDLEAWLTRAPHRYGIRAPQGRKRPLLTSTWSPAAAPTGGSAKPGSEEQLKLWLAFLENNGLPSAVADEVPVEPTPV